LIIFTKKSKLKKKVQIKFFKKEVHMSIHISAKKGDIAKTVLLPGDPLRAKYIADTFLKEVVCYNTVRNMLGYTGMTLDGKKRVSVQGSGMGMPSLGIYVNELIAFYKVKRIIRVGSAGSLKKEIKCQDIVLAQGSCSDSAMNVDRFPAGTNFAPVADWKLLLRAHTMAKQMNIKVTVGNNFSSDKFYGSDAWKKFSEYGVLTVEMETAELYTLAAQSKIQALSILTISNNLITGEELSSREREVTFSNMMKIALSL
jgi:purine-nucleoside phosphorylase